MIRIVIDANILVSASLKRGYSFKVLEEIAADIKSIQVCLSEQVLTEYYNLVFYKRISDKYPLFIKKISTNIEKLERAGTMHFNVLKDVTDNKLLNLAYEANAAYLISGNKNDFSITQFEQAKIVSPKKFCELYEQNAL
jgi:putative PIN family toxin of toxin-antitoxin system